MLSIMCTFISFKSELMEYRISGNSGLQLPVVATGTWLTAGYDKSEREVLQLLKSAFDCGAWFIDTADVYDRGGAEVSVGRFIQEVGRSQLVIGTKVFGQMSASPLSQGLSRRHVMNACDASLQRLQTDYIDLYQCHRYDDNTPLTELLETMDILVRQGKIRYWGVSQWSAVQITNAVRLCEQHRWVKPVSNQPIYIYILLDFVVSFAHCCRPAPAPTPSAVAPTPRRCTTPRSAWLLCTYAPTLLCPRLRLLSCSTMS
jgi:aryl-alcohol dehydrogenase-like predicted oxidoreductase